MSNIINKSNHPVEVKRVELQIWKLRDEIESAIERRMAETGHTEDNPVDIEDIKKFYLKILNPDGNSEAGGEEDSADEVDPNMDSSGNPMDDDAKAMMEALGGGGGDDSADEADAESSDEEAPVSEPEEAEEEASEPPSEEDDAAADLAAQMMADQGLGPESVPEEEDDAAAAMAAQMLADQGMGGDDAAATEEVKAEEVKKEFTRLPPHKSKIVEGFVLLSDIQMDQLMLFSKKNFIHGQNIIINFLVPKPFSQTAEVIASTNIARNSKIISTAKPDFRIQSLFQFKFPAERTNLRNFLTSIMPDIPDPPKKLKRPDGDDDDDFDDLGF